MEVNNKKKIRTDNLYNKMEIDLGKIGLTVTRPEPWTFVLLIGVLSWADKTDVGRALTTLGVTPAESAKMSL